MFFELHRFLYKYYVKLFLFYPVLYHICFTIVDTFLSQGPDPSSDLSI